MSTAAGNEIAAFVAEREGEFIELLRRLIAAPSVNPPGNEDCAARVVADYLRLYGISFETLAAAPRRDNVVARLGAGRPRLLVACHLDVVPPGADWRADPFRLEIRDGMAYGRGACDDKGPLASMLLAGAFLKRAESRIRGQIILVAAADEERGSALGMDWLLREGKLAPDFAIVPDAANELRRLDIAEKGALFLELTAHGRQAHGSRPEQGLNAIWNMTRLLDRLRARKLPHQPHPLLTPPTFNLGGIRGGEAPNMVPARCHAQVDIRYLPGNTSEEIRALVDEEIRAAARETGGSFEIKTIADMPPTEVSADLPLVRTMREATRLVTGAAPELGGMSGATVCKQLILAGIPAIGCGPGDMSQPHTADEHVPLAQLTDFARILALAALLLVGDEQTP